MSFLCGCDDSDYGIVEDDFRVATDPGKCRECGAEIKPGDTEYVRAVALWHEDGPFEDLDDSVLVAWIADPESEYTEYRHCEKCGDLSLSVSDLGLCYILGELIESHREYVEALNGIKS